MYDDLATAPDATFAASLRQRLERTLQTSRSSADSATSHVGSEGQDPTGDLSSDEHEHGSWPRWTWGLVAAFVGVTAIGAALYVRGNANDDPPAPSATTTQGVVTGSSLPDPVSEAVIAGGMLLSESDYGHGVIEVDHAEIAMDPAIAARMPECDPYGDAFTPPNATAWRWFSPTPGAYDPQYVMLFADEATASSVFAVLEDPEFWTTCGAAYVEIEPGVEGWNDKEGRTFPRYLADAVPPEPFPLSGDDLAFFLTRDQAGTVMFAAVRVGRAVVTVQASEDINGFTRISRNDFAAIITDIVRQAQAAQ
jgi:hypothetical protein